ncbi:hypothetical protein SMICM304S_05433 [Streptomyces microflavus]
MSAVFMSRYASPFRPLWRRSPSDRAWMKGNVPVASWSRTVAVPSPVNSRSPTRSCAVPTDIFSDVPRVIPVALRRSWSAPRSIGPVPSGQADGLLDHAAHQLGRPARRRFGG